MRNRVALIFAEIHSREPKHWVPVGSVRAAATDTPGSAEWFNNRDADAGSRRSKCLNKLPDADNHDGWRCVFESLRARQRTSARRISCSRMQQTPGAKPPDESYARSGDVAIAYQLVGDGPMDVVILRGSPGIWSRLGTNR